MIIKEQLHLDYILTENDKSALTVLAGQLCAPNKCNEKTDAKICEKCPLFVDVEEYAICLPLLCQGVLHKVRYNNDTVKNRK